MPHNKKTFAEYRQQVIDIYRKYAPNRVESADRVLAKYRGQEDDLLEALSAKYIHPRPGTTVSFGAQNNRMNTNSSLNNSNSNINNSNNNNSGTNSNNNSSSRFAASRSSSSSSSSFAPSSNNSTANLTLAHLVQQHHQSEPEPGLPGAAVPRHYNPNRSDQTGAGYSKMLPTSYVEIEKFFRSFVHQERVDDVSEMIKTHDMLMHDGILDPLDPQESSWELLRSLLNRHEQAEVDMVLFNLTSAKKANGASAIAAGKAETGAQAASTSGGGAGAGAAPAHTVQPDSRNSSFRSASGNSGSLSSSVASLSGSEVTSEIWNRRTQNTMPDATNKNHPNQTKSAAKTAETGAKKMPQFLSPDMLSQSTLSSASTAGAASAASSSSQSVLDQSQVLRRYDQVVPPTRVPVATPTKRTTPTPPPPLPANSSSSASVSQAASSSSASASSSSQQQQSSKETVSQAESSKQPWRTYNMTQIEFDHCYSLFMTFNFTAPLGILKKSEFSHLAKFLNFAQKEEFIVKLYNEMDGEKNEGITMHNFFSWMGNTQPNAKVLYGMTPLEYRSAIFSFRWFDSDCNGLLDGLEFRTLALRLGFAFDAIEADEMFRVADLDHSCYVDMHQYLLYLAKVKIEAKRRRNQIMELKLKQDAEKEEAKKKALSKAMERIENAPSTDLASPKPPKAVQNKCNQQ